MLSIVPATQSRCARQGTAHTPPRCSTCSVRTVCLPRGGAHQAGDDLAYTRKRLKRGEVLYRMGSDFESVYAVRSGFLQSSTAIEDGREQVTGFHIPGDLVGMDGMASGAHCIAVVAIDDTEVCVIPRARLDERGVHHHVQGAMARELARAQDMFVSLGTLRAQERLAAFLVAFSKRMLALGYARDEFNLPMMRLAIGSYLGLSFETVSRVLGHFRDTGLINVEHKRIRIVDMQRLRSFTSPPRPGATRAFR